MEYEGCYARDYQLDELDEKMKLPITHLVGSFFLYPSEGQLVVNEENKGERGQSRRRCELFILAG